MKPKLIVPLVSGFSVTLLAIWQILLVWLLVRTAGDVLATIGSLF